MYQLIKYARIFLSFCIVIVLVFPSVIPAKSSGRLEYNPPIVRFEKDGKTIILLGACHEARLQDVLEDADIDKLKESSALYIEHDIGDTALQFKKLGFAITPEEQAQNFASQYGALERFLQTLVPKSAEVIVSINLETGEPIFAEGFSYAELLQWEPWIVGLMLGNQLSLQVMQETGGMELAMAKLFKEQGKPVEILETTQEIFDILKQHKDEFTALEIRKRLLTLSDAGLLAQAKRELTNTADCTFQKATKRNVRHPESVSARNELWMQKIIQEIVPKIDPGQSVLIVVGYGHLSGPQGLVQRLIGEKFQMQ